MTKKRFGGYNEASEITGYKVSTLRIKVMRKQIPFIRISEARVRFDLDALEQWMLDQHDLYEGGK